MKVKVVRRKETIARKDLLLSGLLEDTGHRLLKIIP